MKSAPPQQLSLFDSPAFRLGALGRAVKAALNRAAKESDLSREELVHRAEELAAEAGVNLCPGGGLGGSTLNKWLDLNSPGHMPSLLGLAVLCQVLDDAGPLAPVLEYLGLEAMGPEDQRYRDIGRAYLGLKQAQQGLKKAEER